MRPVDGEKKKKSFGAGLVYALFQSHRPMRRSSTSRHSREEKKQEEKNVVGHYPSHGAKSTQSRTHSIVLRSEAYHLQKNELKRREEKKGGSSAEALSGQQPH